MLYSIQYLRFLAALLVLLHHVTQSLQRDLGSTLMPVYHNGIRGVDLFFVISGFIMVHVTAGNRPSVTAGNRPGAQDFMLRRIARVAPPYWVAMGAIIAIALAMPHLLQATRLEWPHVIASFLFIPWDHPVTYFTFPVLHVGWTLNYEMQFYVIFALVLAFAPAHRVLAASALLVALVVAGWALQPQSVQLSFWTAPILLEFVFGMGLAALWHRAAQRDLRVPGWLGWLVLAGGFVALILLPPGESGDTLAHGVRWLVAGVPAAVMLAGALLLERAGAVRKLPTLRLLGDASYALYIWHFFVIGVCRALWPKALVGIWVWDMLFVTIVSAIAIIGSVIAYLWLEKPLVRWSQAALMRLVHRPANPVGG